MKSLSLPAPPLEGGGVVLRPWREADVDHLVAAWKDPEVRRWMSVPDDAGTGRATAWIGGAQHRLATGVSLDLVVVDDKGVLLGEVGLSGLDGDRRVGLIGWWTACHARRNGVATQAVSMLVEWSLGPPLDLVAVLARIQPSNEGSLGVARAVGFQVLATREDEGVVMVAVTRQGFGSIGADQEVSIE